MNADDPRLASYDLRATFQIDPEGRGRSPGEVTAIIARRGRAAAPPLAPSIRNLVLYPGRFVNQKVTITGQFGGRNLLGDLPDAPGKQPLRLRAALGRRRDLGRQPAAARPADFELALDARIDTGRWVEVSGTSSRGAD